MAFKGLNLTPLLSQARGEGGGGVGCGGVGGGVPPAEKSTLCRNLKN